MEPSDLDDMADVCKSSNSFLTEPSDGDLNDFDKRLKGSKNLHNDPYANDSSSEEDTSQPMKTGPIA